MDQAFPYGMRYGCAIEREDKSGQHAAGIVLAIVIGVALAAYAVHWWAS